jgi:hypothetical protein
VKTSITTSPIDGSVAFRWLTRCRITRIRDRYGEDIFEALFRQIVEICQARGLVGSRCRVMTDATLIAADASELSRAADKELHREQGFATAGTAAHERGSAARQAAASDFVESCDARRGLGKGTGLEVLVDCTFAHRFSEGAPARGCAPIPHHIECGSGARPDPAVADGCPRLMISFHIGCAYPAGCE